VGRLILELRPGERVRLTYPNGPEVWVGADVRNGRPVRVFFQAPEEVRIWREELLARPDFREGRVPGEGG
jgi:sRNA-binding carbon storage regulator CsrA